MRHFAARYFAARYLTALTGHEALRAVVSPPVDTHDGAAPPRWTKSGWRRRRRQMDEDVLIAMLLQ